MPTPHDATTIIDSCPGRDFLIQRVIYAIAGDEDPTDLIVIDPVSGVRPNGLAYNGRLFWLDPLDTTTAHDGITCIRTGDPLRYKRDTIDPPKSVLDKDLSSPPSTPVVGDAFIVGPAATGAWAGHSDDIAILTSGGWGFITPAVGLSIYVEDEESTYHVDTLGNWVIGIGSNALAADSVLPSQIKGGGGRVFWIVENQTTNAPPAVTEGTAYIIGPSPSGVWTGNPAKIAHGENGSWVIYTPTEGWLTYDKALDDPYRFNGSSWITAGGNMQMNRTIFTTSGTFSKNARCVFVDVTVVGGVGGADCGVGGAGTATNGGTSSFGAHCSATGSTASNNAGSTIGNGSGGDFNAPGSTAINRTVTDTGLALEVSSPGHQSTQLGLRFGTIHVTTNLSRSSSGPGLSKKRILAATLGTSETVTVGAAGGAGTGVAGIVGIVIVEEWVLI